MVITKIEAVNQKKCRIYIDEEYVFALYKGEVRSYHLREGDEMPDAVYREIMDELLPKRGKSRAMYLLGTMDRTEGQIEQKLCVDGYPDEVIEKVLEFVRQCHYVDDERYVFNYLNAKCATKSVRQMKAELMAKGIPSSRIDEVLQQQEPMDEAAAIRRWIEKKNIDPQHDSREKIQKFCQFLQRKGFLYEDIATELRR